MRIDRLEPSRRKRGRVLVYLEDGTLLKITEQELLTFGLRAGDELSGEALSRLREAAGVSNVKALAAELIGKRPLSRRDLIGKLREKGASPEDAENAAQWLTELGALDDAVYAALIAWHCYEQGYGPRRIREKLYEKGVPRELWEDALRELPEPDGAAFLSARLRGRMPDEKEKRRLTAAMQRRGFSWGDIQSAWSRYGAELDPCWDGE